MNTYQPDPGPIPNFDPSDFEPTLDSCRCRNPKCTGFVEEKDGEGYEVCQKCGLVQ